ncbi:D-2-hydroxyacid dehydrogenase [Flavicella sp.]|uniref:D-2-hydroxyacid dehydrogenase n=1 Tax=Flavicella sp. TaxID=2957742 RepID=UPI00263068BA|nr:D-2-hydroxyacid dehydrogenase [Flavicella sp.]MDG1805337.1 D-2-hydroxyacid dehydrogenase [Flavicella sp.]
MKIVVLDGYTLNPGDLSWDALKELGEVVVYDRLENKTDAIVEVISEATIVFTNKTVLSKEVLEKATTIKYIGVLATGFNVVDIETATSKNIVVTNIPAYGTKAVAQFVMGLLLEMCHHIGDHNTSVQNKAWVKSADFCYWNTPLIELEGKTMGLIGFGKIGQATAQLAQAFGMKVLVYNRTIKKEFESDSLAFVSLEELVATSDVISLHCALTDSNQGLINKSLIEQMKREVMLINTSRGGLVNENDLAEALNNDRIYAAAVDVVSTEPMKANNPLLGAKNCIITPHIAWATKAARQRLMHTAVGNLKAYLSGEVINKVN